VIPDDGNDERALGGNSGVMTHSNFPQDKLLNDVFWFTFFHEAAHIILHGKKDVFLENMDYPDMDPQKEREADEFAIQWTFSWQQQERLMAHYPIQQGDIPAFAKEFNTHPALIIGRLQHLRLISYATGRQYIQSVVLE